MDSPEVPTPLVVGDRIILITDRGHVSCHDVATGEQHWWADLPKNRNPFYSSPVLAGNTLYCTREDGTIFSCEINDRGLTVVAENDLGEQLIATPIPIRNQLLVRGSETLYMFQ
jgi:outer membrane protein assembly factor BamB